MKTILKYGQTVLARNKGQTDNLSVFHAGVDAVKDGYNVRNFERVTTTTGATVIRKRRSGAVVIVGDCIFIGFGNFGEEK